MLAIAEEIESCVSQMPTLDIEKGSPANGGRKSDFLDAKSFNF